VAHFQTTVIYVNHINPGLMLIANATKYDIEELVLSIMR